MTSNTLNKTVSCSRNLLACEDGQERSSDGVLIQLGPAGGDHPLAENDGITAVA